MPSGKPSMKERMTIKLNTPIIPGRTYTQKLFSNDKSRISRKVGINPPLKYIVNTNASVTNLRKTNSLRLIVYATIAEQNTVTKVPITVRNTEIPIELTIADCLNTYS